MHDLIVQSPSKGAGASPARVATASLVGTAFEYYDFFLYGTAAALVFNRLYFPASSPLAATLASLATFAVGFVARPIGAVIFSHIGDRYGRRIGLILTIVLMGVASGVIGLVPTHASIGVAAPIALVFLRLCQGLAAGGEWGGAVVLSMEHAPPRLRPLYGAIPMLGSPIGQLLGTGFFTVVALLPDPDFFSWGWRIPFLVSFGLLAIGLWLRLKVDESPMFVASKAEEERAGVEGTGATTRSPLIDVMLNDWPRVLLGSAAAFIGIGGYFLMTTFMMSYGTTTLGLSRSLVLQASAIGAFVELVVIAIAGILSSKFGPWRVCMFGCVSTIMVAGPCTLAIGSGSPGAIVFGIVLVIGCVSIPFAPIGALLASMFPTRTRYSGTAVSFNISSVIGGATPLLATAAMSLAGGQLWMVGVLVVMVAVVSVIGLLGIRIEMRRHAYL
ncbi:MHS family MFS transporter [Mycobacterium sp. 21AC1]|uniref:MFS transporter n=1 Tax=[Mycobacterium] appelbergii TaxID=2939269 RepID=UPI0029390AB3|nr:MFS transporter [Mycobacterium sp. 21AC1]MDV3128432.1 MHS family MFS transporter [Mycobacterium sp. 21AC1]